MKARVLTVAGSDSAGGAGIQADLKTMLAHGVHGMSAVTAVTAQSSVGVHGVHVLPPEVVVAQIRAVVDDIGVDAVKVGMLGAADVVAAVAAALPRDVPLVVDPVSVSKHGDPLLHPDALEVLLADLVPLATVLTPNLDEAALMTGLEVLGRHQMRAAADALLRHGPQWVLVKGGHLPGEAVDLLTDGTTVHWLSAPRLDNRHTHGTGCSLASAIASRLALGQDVEQAVRASKEWLTGAIAHGFALGAGIGPVDHGWALAEAPTSRG